jgi:hypothetical protein
MKLCGDGKLGRGSLIRRWFGGSRRWQVLDGAGLEAVDDGNGFVVEHNGSFRRQRNVRVMTDGSSIEAAIEGGYCRCAVAEIVGCKSAAVV